MEEVIINLLNQFERGAITRRQLVQGLTFGVASLAMGGAARAAAKPAPQGFKATGVNHISFGVADYARTRDFYADLFGMKVSADDGKQCYLSFGETVLIARKSHQPGEKPFVDHIAYTIDNWSHEGVEQELKRRGLNPQVDYDSFHFVDPDGYDVQIAGKDFMKTP
ncbi:MAG TPA: VOC family protein [Steroidobacteraceae bacterium]|nr:VOC family protein [Steroidobacteraceae bacterium]